jgi:thiamine pyrophosphate-dependent acetolactate synthase large subunit-like protein
MCALDRADCVVVIADEQRLSVQGHRLSDETSYARIAEGFGCHSETVTRAADVGPAMLRAIQRPYQRCWTCGPTRPARTRG